MTDPDDAGPGPGPHPVLTSRGRLSEWSGPGDVRADDARDAERLAPAVLRRENQDLRDALSTQPVIDQAKGALMLRYHLDADSAFGLLVRWSQHANIKVRDLAQLLVDSIVTGDLGSTDGTLARELEQVLRHGDRGTAGD